MSFFPKSKVLSFLAAIPDNHPKKAVLEVDPQRQAGFSVNCGTSDGRKELKTAGALFTKKGGDKRCAFCLGGHLPVDCKKVQDIGECKKLSLNYGRCFRCIEKIHRSHHCSITVECKVCNGQDSCPLGK